MYFPSLSIPPHPFHLTAIPDFTSILDLISIAAGTILSQDSPPIDEEYVILQGIGTLVQLKKNLTSYKDYSSPALQRPHVHSRSPFQQVRYSANTLLLLKKNLSSYKDYSCPVLQRPHFLQAKLMFDVRDQMFFPFTVDSISSTRPL